MSIIRRKNFANIWTSKNICCNSKYARYKNNKFVAVMNLLHMKASKFTLAANVFSCSYISKNF